MAKEHLLETDTANLNKILGSGYIYSVPLFQRDYSWEEENWEDLWNDIINVESQDKPHYMGSIVLQNMGGKRYTIIDGQQRIATLSIIVIATIQKIKTLILKGDDIENNGERIRLLTDLYLGKKDIKSLMQSSKLFLNENNNSFYQEYLLQFRAPINPKKLSSSDKLLYRAYNFFYQKINDRFIINGNGESIAEFLSEIIAERLMFIQIIVEDEFSAYTVFETLNSRGVDLTATDLLKNLLFSKVSSSETDLTQVKQKWRRIIDLIELKDFPIFLRHYLNSVEPIVTKENLYKNVREKIRNNSDVFNLLENLERAAYVYVALGNPNDELWENNRDIKKHIRELKLFQVVQFKPLLLSAKKIFNDSEFVKLLKMSSVISFRYNVMGGLNPKLMEQVYNKAAILISKNEINTARQAFQELKQVYPSDEDFKNAFATKSINTNRNKNLVRYILFEIENQICNVKRDYEIDSASIEHILPENPGAEWNAYFSREDLPNYIYSLGNYTLLESIRNSRIGTSLFESKKEIFLTSQYALSNSLGNLTTNAWDAGQIKKRQTDLAKKATAIWKIDY